MWVCLNSGFVSVVEDRERPGNLLVRARAKKHLSRLFHKSRVRRTPQSDYRWRVSASREEVAQLMASVVMGIDYGNFKDSVREKELHDMYALWWNDHYKYQRNRE